jgi:hypothetical protein
MVDDIAWDDIHLSCKAKRSIGSGGAGPDFSGSGTPAKPVFPGEHSFKVHSQRKRKRFKREFKTERRRQQSAAAVVVAGRMPTCISRACRRTNAGECQRHRECCCGSRVRVRQQVKDACRKGIPIAHRGYAWYTLSGAKALRDVNSPPIPSPVPPAPLTSSSDMRSNPVSAACRMRYTAHRSSRPCTPS